VNFEYFDDGVIKFPTTSPLKGKLSLGELITQCLGVIPEEGFSGPSSK
jgi:hypothetical protein